MNLTMSNPALELRQNLLRYGDHSALLGNYPLKNASLLKRAFFRRSVQTSDRDDSHFECRQASANSPL
jgi:hypothetical protein